VYLGGGVQKLGGLTSLRGGGLGKSLGIEHLHDMKQLNLCVGSNLDRSILNLEQNLLSKFTKTE